ncbi:MAG: arylsulfatase [Planctomycetota bacterium]
MTRYVLPILLVFLSIKLVGAAEPGSDEPVKPNIILLVADDLGWGDVGYHGSRIQTPNIDALAEKGVTLEQFYVQPLCSPTRAALMTGRYPIRYGLQVGVVRPWADYGLPAEETLLPQLLATVGYETAMAGKWHLGEYTTGMLPRSRGFDHQYGHYLGAIDYFEHTRDGGHDWHRNDQPVYEKGYSTDLIANEAIARIKNRDKTKSLFLYVAFNAPHTPLQAPKEFIDKYAHYALPARQKYAAMVDCMDAAIGRILETAKGELEMKNTLIVFCSDNGGIRTLGSNGELRAGKGSLYEGGIRVPAVVHWQGKLQPGTTEQPMHAVDLVPTIASLTGIQLDPNKPLDGLDVWPTIAEGKASPHKFILHNATPERGAMRAGPWKLIWQRLQSKGTVESDSERERWELYNIATDPKESNDLSETRSSILNRLKSEYRELAKSAAKPLRSPAKPPEGFTSPKIWGHR